ncbi:hypothetical protein GGI25_004126 [Coemansia spiralis]|uniref:Uncharacterized protein n=2 Tax=Coemansia TaxID=4863 RepID=A0A9W8KVW4_9FUNG|nr:hypothetical protein EDC05_003929 [Coemansia umbellata]KAJ2622410.1 hypothetical protein GGI26_003273 [Coemansia sp. RSA 1358]KAJ2675077.1 hypothetical protein GGI25_004126 [Coemansia spiralis]
MIGKGNIARRYSLHVPGADASEASSVSELCISGKGLEELVADAVDGHSERVVWLDITRPSTDDVDALARIFGIRQDIVDELHRCAMEARGIGRAPVPTCRRHPGGLYVCWAEGANEKAGRDDTAGAGLLDVLERCKPRYNISRSVLQSIVHRWGHDKWAVFVDHRLKKTPQGNELPPATGQASCYRMVQMYQMPRLLVTLHADESPAISKVQREVAKHQGALWAERIVQAVLCRWVAASSSGLAELEHGDAVASRRLALAMLRMCQTNQMLLRRLHVGHTAHNGLVCSLAQLVRLPHEAVYAMLYRAQAGFLRRYEHIDHRLATADALQFAWQCSHLLKMGRRIHKIYGVWLLFHFIYAPIELWNGLNKLNCATTPLQNSPNSVVLFYYQLIGFALWVATACLLYRSHTKRLARQHQA